MALWPAPSFNKNYRSILMQKLSAETLERIELEELLEEKMPNKLN